MGTSESTVITAVANGASYAQAFAPGMLMTVFGTGLAPVTRSATALPLPLDIAGVSATVNGVSAPLYYVSPGQVNVQVPYETGMGLAILGVNNNGQVASFPFTVAPAAPGLFTAPDGTLVPSATARQGQTAVAFITGDGDTTTFLITGASPPSRHRDRSPAAPASARHRHRGRPRRHRFLRRNPGRAGRCLAGELHRARRHPARPPAGGDHRRRRAHTDRPPQRDPVITLDSICPLQWVT